MGKSKNAKNRDKKKKLVLVFDETKRREFLGGFHKRKVERRKKAQEELKEMLKEEKRRIKQENKESYKKLVVSSRPIPELEKLLQDEYSDKEEDVSVKIVELPVGALADSNKFLGANKAAKIIKPAVDKKSKESEKEAELPGMGFEEDNCEVESEEEKKEETAASTVSTKKDLKRILKHQATKKIQKSKAFQIKNKMERLKNKKKSRRVKSNNHKIKSRGNSNKSGKRK